MVVQQSSGDWDAKDANMASYRFLVQQLSGYFEGCEFLHVPRNDNEQADALARIGSTRQGIPTGVALQRLLKPSVKPSPESDSIFVPAPPEVVGSDSRAPTDDMSILAGGVRSWQSHPARGLRSPARRLRSPAQGLRHSARRLHRHSKRLPTPTRHLPAQPPSSKLQSWRLQKLQHLHGPSPSSNSW